MQVNIQDAKTQLSRLVDAALAGEDVIIARSGVPCVKLVSVTQEPRRPGSARQRARVTDAFFEPLPEQLLAAFGQS